MPWSAETIKFDLLSVEWFIDKLVAVFTRDYANALAHYSPSETLRGLQAIRTARQVSQQWPVLNLLPGGSDPAMSEDAARIAESQRILCEWETVARVPDTLARHINRYVTAGRSVLYEMSKTDLTTGIAQGRRTGLSWNVSSERYGERFYEAENLWTMVGSVVLTINYWEGRRNG
jgi:hypothetical protein